MKIAFTSTYSWPSFSGVWTRIENLACELIKKGHEVHTFSSNLRAGTSEKLKSYEQHKGIHIHRYPVRRKISKNASFWTSGKMILDLHKLKPDIIDCNTYRHPESNFIMKLNRKLKAKIFLTTHAPFLEKGIRPKKLSIASWLYDKLYAKKIFKSFNKIIAITKWEIPCLTKLGLKKEKLVYLPNPIPNEFFESKPKKGKGILFLGRISQIKDIETLLKATERLGREVDLVGPIDEDYKKKLRLKNTKLLPPVFNINKKIKIYDNHEIFVLPSKREGLPISLIEAMARGKICVSSKTQGGKELIVDGKNGFLFEIGNHEQLSKIIHKVQNMPEKQKGQIREQARKTAEKFKASEIVKKYESLF